MRNVAFSLASVAAIAVALVAGGCGAPALVVLRPGAVAYAAFNQNSCVVYAPSSAVGGEVVPPGSSQPLAFDLQHNRILDYCPAGDPGHVVDISPVEPVSRDVLAAF